MLPDFTGDIDIVPLDRVQLDALRIVGARFVQFGATNADLGVQLRNGVGPCLLTQRIDGDLLLEERLRPVELVFRIDVDGVAIREDEALNARRLEISFERDLIHRPVPVKPDRSVIEVLGVDPAGGRQGLGQPQGRYGDRQDRGGLNRAPHCDPLGVEFGHLKREIGHHVLIDHGAENLAFGLLQRHAAKVDPPDIRDRDRTVILDRVTKAAALRGEKPGQRFDGVGRLRRGERDDVARAKPVGAGVDLRRNSRAQTRGAPFLGDRRFGQGAEARRRARRARGARENRGKRAWLIGARVRRGDAVRRHRDDFDLADRRPFGDDHGRPDRTASGKGQKQTRH